MTAVAIIVGLGLLAIGGSLLVRGAARLALAAGLSPLVVGLIVVGFGTSTPELVTSVLAAREGAGGIAVGGVIGSGIANILLILGVAGLIAPIPTRRSALRRDAVALLGSSVIALGVLMTGQLSRPLGAVLLLLLVGYMAWTYRSEQAAAASLAAVDETPVKRNAGAIAGALGLTLLGITATVAGARALVVGAIDLAQAWGASQTLIGVTVVAIGTSLPELVACAIAAHQRQPEVALGNVIGSNVFNVLGVLGATALVSPLTIPPELARMDGWVLVGVTVLLLVLLRTASRLSRREAALLLALYGIYLAHGVLAG